MNSLLVALVAVALGHSAAAYEWVPMKEYGPEPTRGLLGNLIDLAIPDFKPHVVGGQEAQPHSHPHQVALAILTTDGQNAVCGGSLLTPEWVLTAAHCAHQVKSIAVLLGVHDVSKREAERQEIPAVKAVKHTWDPDTNVNDIALLKLARPATLNQWVQPIRLPPASMEDQDLAKTPIVMTGWGRTSDDSNDISKVLMEVKSSVLDSSSCKRFYGSVNVRVSNVCADGSQLAGVCRGDSGGPMVITEADGQKTVIGVTSFGSKRGCQKRYPTVFTRVDNYLDWISKITGLSIRQN